jgi:hypothetical protein
VNVTKLKNLVTSKVGRQVLIAQKHSPTILFGVGIVGVVGTAVLASRATLKADAVTADAQQKLKEISKLEAVNYTEEDRQKDKALVMGQTAVKLVKLYAPAVAVGTLSIAALTGSHHVMSRRNAGLMAAYATLEKGYEQYRQRVLAEVGEEKEREFRYGMETRTVVDETDKGPVTSEVKRVAPNGQSVYAKFFDEFSSSWQRNPEYNYIFLKCQQNYANDMLRARGHLFLNEVYDMLGIERTTAGSVVGWVISKTGDNFVDFGIFDGDNPRARDFVNGREGSILLDFNVDGVIYDKI